jgi:hypothetical protein
VPDLEERAIRQLHAGDAFAFHEGAVPRALVLQEPAAEDALQRCVRGGEKAVRHLQPELRLPS